MSIIEERIIEELAEELGVDEEEIESKVKYAYAEVRSRRSYPSHFTEADIEKDLDTLSYNIRALALYDYNQIGAEGQLTHSEKGTMRAWKNREECLKGVFAWAGF